MWFNKYRNSFPDASIWTYASQSVGFERGMISVGQSIAFDMEMFPYSLRPVRKPTAAHSHFSWPRSRLLFLQSYNFITFSRTFQPGAAGGVARERNINNSSPRIVLKQLYKKLPSAI